MNSNDFKKISYQRLNEVKHLIKGGYYSTANYLSGYVIEAALKACICNVLKNEYPDSNEYKTVYFTHKFNVLLKLSGLEIEFNNNLNSNSQFKANWSIINGWNESIRYMPNNNYTKQDSKAILKALLDKDNGIFTWIKSKW